MPPFLDTNILLYSISTVIAAAIALGCDRLYTEDLTDGQSVDGLTVVNPFR
jgi:predicted nucleic acid-binding protein